MKKKLNVLVVLLMLVVLLGSTSVVFAAEDLGTWTTKANMPTARSYLGAATVNGKIYAIGGSYGVYFSTVEEYNSSTDTWTAKANMPTPRDKFGIDEVNEKIYVIGGSTSSDYSNAVEEYNPLTDTWTTKASMPTSRTGLGVAEVDGKIYAIGGQGPSATYYSIVEEYDPITDTWTTKASMPTERAYFGITEANGKIYIMGGDNGGSGLDTIEVYDPLTDTWETKTNMPVKRTRLEASTANGKIYVIGGYSDSSLDIVEEYEPLTDTWKTMNSMLTRRHNFATAEANGQIYAIGGLGDDSVEVFTPPIQTPEAPTNLTATTGDSQVSLSWNAVTDATSYTVKRATTSGGPYTTIASDITNTSYIDTNVTNGTTYYYVVSVIISGIESADSNEASATPEVSTPVQTGSAILVIKMVDGIEKEYDLTMIEVNAFIDWYDTKDNGTGDAYYTIKKTWNNGPFASRKDYIIFDKICYFEINEY